MLDQKTNGTKRTDDQVQQLNKQLGKKKKEFIDAAAPMGSQQWNTPLSADEVGKTGNRTNGKNKKK